jgi:hypothetical protein
MNSRRFIALTPNPRIMGSIAGQGRASQQKRTSHVRYGSIATGAVEVMRPCMSALPQKLTNSRRVSKSRFVLNKRLSPHLRLVGRTGISFSKRPTWRMRQ